MLICVKIERMLKIGVLGAGHLGKIHLRLLKELEGVELVGFYDPDPSKAAEAASKFELKAFDDMDSLIEAVDAVDIVTPTLSHFDCARKAICASKHIFIEKPLASTTKEAEKLVELVHEAGIKAQVGHVERFNPAFLAIKDETLNPMFIETHRLAQFNPRGTDVSVIQDLMIHDIDIILSIIDAKVKKIHASGVPIISASPDIANARIEFDNGAVANVTASRISIKNMRKMRVFQPDAYISVDFLDKKTEIISIKDEAQDEQSMLLEMDDNHKKYINFRLPDIADTNAIQMELACFRDAIRDGSETPVTVEDGCNAMQVAARILEKIEKLAIS